VIHRRTFISAGGLGFLIAAQLGWSQQTKSPYRIALVEAGTPSANQHFIDAFLVGLREFGYVPGKSIVVDARWAEGRVEGFRRALDELIPLRPEVIVVSSTLGAVEAKKATTSIPVIFIGVTDPVGDGLVSSLARPGGNITGLARTAGEGLIPKTVQALRELVPSATRMAILWNPGGSIEVRRRQVMAAAEGLGITRWWLKCATATASARPSR
jgi:putative ABC transport system substrate-binding protein